MLYFMLFLSRFSLGDYKTHLLQARSDRLRYRNDTQACYLVARVSVICKRPCDITIFIFNIRELPFF